MVQEKNIRDVVGVEPGNRVTWHTYRIVWNYEVGRDMKKKIAIILGAIGIVIIAVCVMGSVYIVRDKDALSFGIIGGADGPTSIFLAGKLPGGEQEVAEYISITMEEAKEIFETPGEYIVVDVRRADEFAQGHIPGAINIANEDISDTEPTSLPDKDQTIYVYCRSGNRSKQAAGKLASMGYSNIIEFGGIIDWTGDIEK